LSPGDSRRLGRQQRLGHKEIVALLSVARPVKRPGLSVMLKANAVGFCRLGLIVPKRVFPRAVDRTRTKRMLREWFRAHQRRLGTRDILIRITGQDVSLAELEHCVGRA
jgi:ribonuclease P protein component